MIIITDHAREEMEDEGITEEEVHHCLEHGDLKIEMPVDGEMRYGKKVDCIDKTIMVIYAYREGTTRVITAHTVRRKHDR
ncbi:MAG TPA: DUF4258 domain-containing protein [Candidatus Nanoarchaeia archaeon]|nr:DUF4258 domain-containing protein [Candidatus Nanoarchaeia archaeon]